MNMKYMRPGIFLFFYFFYFYFCEHDNTLMSALMSTSVNALSIYFEAKEMYER